MISRGQMRFQVSTPPERASNGERSIVMAMKNKGYKAGGKVKGMKAGGKVKGMKAGGKVKGGKACGQVSGLDFRGVF